ncbi:MAG: TolC family protein [Armatimonadota bacterium]|jgi:outer membrane protein TolC
MIRHLLCIAFVAWAALPALGAEEPSQAPLRLTLPRAVELALQQNAALRVRAAEAEAALEQARSLGKPPPIEFSLSLTSVIEELEWVVSKLFGFVGKRKYESKAARAQHAALVAGNAEFVLELAAAAKAAYWSLALADRSIEIAATKVRQTEQVRDATQALLAAGAGMQIDVARADADVVAARQELTSARTTRQEANAELALLLGERPERQLIPTDAAAPAGEEPPPGHQLQGVALARRPAVTRLEALAEAAEQGVKLARAERIPGLAIGATREDETRFGFLELSFPLIDLGSIRHGVRSAQWSAKAIRAELDVARQQIRTEVEVALTRLTDAQQRLDTITTDRLPRQQDLVTRIRGGYEQNALTLLDLLDAQRSLNDLRAEELAASQAYHTAAAGLERATGTALTELEGATNDNVAQESR